MNLRDGKVPNLVHETVNKIKKEEFQILSVIF